MEAEEHAEARLSFVVGEEDTAAVLGSGDLPVLGTPRLLAWAEAATCQVAQALLPRGATTVGTDISLEHRRPTPVGARVWVTAALTQRDERRLVLKVVAVDSSDEVVGAGIVTRAVVDRERFLARLSR